jgi:hypothetical protein
MTTYVRDLVDLIAAAGLGTEAVDLFEGTLPDKDTVPGAVMAVDASFGRASTYSFDNGGMAVASGYPRAQLLFRDVPEEFDAPLQRALGVFDYFDTHAGFVVNGHYYPRVANLQTPAKIGGQQGDGRWLLGFNVELQRNP